MDKQQALEELKSLTGSPHDECIGKLSDTEIKNLIAKRYESIKPDNELRNS